MNKVIFHEGDEIVSVRSVGLYKGFYAFRPKLYEAIARKKDGVVTWQMVARLGHPCRSRDSAILLAKEIAKEMDIPFHEDIRHGDPLELANS